MRALLDPIFSTYCRSDAPGCIVGVARSGQAIYRAAFGMANIEHGVVNTASTPMPIASITKQFTCAALLTLAAEGKLRLDDPVGRWIPELSTAAQRPTLFELMTHTGGIRCYLDHAVFNGYATMPAGIPSTIQYRQSDVNFEPGQGASYSNGGYLLLSWVVGRAGGAPFESILNDRLFAPLSMNATCLPRWSSAVQPGVATTYQARLGDPEGRWRHSMVLMEESLGDGGMTSTVDDLLRWAAFLRASKGPVSLHALAQMTPLANGAQSPYGFGLINESYRGVKLIHHAGGLPGASSTLLILPEEDLDIVVLCNRPAPAVGLSLQILDALIPDRLESPSAPPATPEFEPLIGHYVAQDTGLMFGFADIEGRLGLSLFGAPAFPLDTHREMKGALPFGADVGTGTMRFRAAHASTGVIDGMEYCDGGVWYGARRIAGPRMTPDGVVSAASGIFRSESAAATLRFVVIDGHLAAEFQGEYGRARHSAESIGPDLIRFWPSQFPGGALVRLERSAGSVDHLVISTSRTRRTVFRRGPERDR